jgi:RNA polymerase sigma factor (sigma-70 family)
MYALDTISLKELKADEVIARIPKLTKREREVMDLVFYKEMTNKQVAHKLGLSHRTVELHRSRVMSKLKVDNLVKLCKILALESTVTE